MSCWTLDEATGARVITSVPDARGRLRFAHSLIRETLYDFNCYDSAPSPACTGLQGRHFSALRE